MKNKEILKDKKVYKVESKIKFGMNENLILTKFYLPIIGHNAFSLIQFLISESHEKVSNLYFPIDRIKKSIQLTKEQLLDSINNLIKYDLLILKDNNDKVILELVEPKNKKDYFSNKELTNELELKISKDNFNILRLTNISNNKIDKVEQLEKIKPTAFAETILNRKLSSNEIKLIETLTKEYGLSPLQINLIIDYSFIVNKKITLNYVLKIADTVLEKNLKNKDDLIKFFKDNFNNKKQIVKTDNKIAVLNKIKF